MNGVDFLSDLSQRGLVHDSTDSEAEVDAAEHVAALTPVVADVPPAHTLEQRMHGQHTQLTIEMLEKLEEQKGSRSSEEEWEEDAKERWRRERR